MFHKLRSYITKEKALNGNSKEKKCISKAEKHILFHNMEEFHTTYVILYIQLRVQLEYFLLR